MTTTTLLNAVRDGELQTIRELLQGNQALDVNTIRGNDDQTPLHIACKHGRLEMAKLLIQENNADVNAVDNTGCTPLIYTCAHHSSGKENYTAVMELLLENGANANTKSNIGWTALHYAGRCGRKRMVDLLLNHGVDINVQTRSGMTPLHYACYDPQIDVVKLLLANYADRHVKNNMGNEPAELLQACTHGQYGVFTSYDKLPLAASGLDKTRTTCKKRNRMDEMVRLNQHLSQHQHTLALKALLLVRQLPVYEVAYEILGFLTPAAVEKICLPVE